MNQSVSVYVPAWNAERTIGRCLESLLAQTVPFDEILVVDDGSKDATAEIAARYVATVVPNGVNRGLGYTRNVGVAHCRNELVASVDSDCILERTWLEMALPALEDVHVACVGGALSEYYAESASDLWRSRHLPQSWGTNRIVNPSFLFGCNLLARKDAIRAAGGYDTTLRTNGEDVDLSTRLRQEGYLLVYEPSAKAYHLQQDTLWSAMKRWWRWHHWGETQGSLRAAVRNSPQNLARGFEFAVQDLGYSPRLVPIDLVFPLAQAYLDAHCSAHRDEPERRTAE